MSEFIWYEAKKLENGFTANFQSLDSWNKLTNSCHSIEETRETLDKFFEKWGVKPYQICKVTSRTFKDENGRFIREELITEAVEVYPKEG